MAYSSAAFEPTFFGTGSAISAATFAPGTNINAASPITTVIADLDGDGKPDLVVDDVMPMPFPFSKTSAATAC
jgi:hypothetical protein